VDGPAAAMSISDAVLGSEAGPHSSKPDAAQLFDAVVDAWLSDQRQEESVLQYLKPTINLCYK
jgi:hypothetical protein